MMKVYSMPMIVVDRFSKKDHSIIWLEDISKVIIVSDFLLPWFWLNLLFLLEKD